VTPLLQTNNIIPSHAGVSSLLWGFYGSGLLLPEMAQKSISSIFATQPLRHINNVHTNNVRRSETILLILTQTFIRYRPIPSLN